MLFKKWTGAGSRVRTRDPLITNQVLYQLSYTGARVHLASLRGAINGQTCDIAGPRLLGGRGIRRARVAVH